jgi:hypothetical protein
VTPRAPLHDEAWTLLREALGLYSDSPRATEWLHHQLQRFSEPLGIAVAGAAGTGKSTLINALVGEEVAPVQAADGTGVLTWYRDGPAPRATVHSAEGTAQEVPAARLEDRLRVDLSQWQPHHIDRLAVDWPARVLRHATLIDVPTPRSTVDLLAEADAVLYLARNVDSADLNAPRSAGTRDTAIARAAPVNTILVLSRADELGAGRIDALSSAKLIARRHRGDVQTRSTYQNVVAVAGLVASASRTLREPEFTALSQLAGVPRPELEDFLLSPDRFVRAEFPAPVGPDVRAALLARFGIFGVRLATTLVRGGCNTARKLSTQLDQRSGLTELRDSIARDFTDRHPALKARSALLALEHLLRTEPRPGTGSLLMAMERLLASAHDFQELRLLAALRTGRTVLPPELGAPAQHLLGGRGTSPAARLATEESATDSQLLDAATRALRQWQEQAANPVLSQHQRHAARVVVRSCEGILHELSQAPATR